MDFNLLIFLAAGLTGLTSITMLLSRDWRWSILALAGQYAGVFFLVWLSWPLEMAVVKLVAGWMSGAVLGTTRINLSLEELASSRPADRAFRLLAAGLALLVIVSLAPRAVVWVPDLAPVQAVGAMILMGIGLLHLGFSAHPFRVVLGLLTVLSGFEIVYAAVESSTLVAALLAGVNLGLALVGAYLLLAPTLEGAE